MFGGKLFRLPEHLVRLEESLAIVGTQLRMAIAELGDIAEQLVCGKMMNCWPRGISGLSMFVTPGLCHACGTRRGHFWPDCGPATAIRCPINCGARNTPAANGWSRRKIASAAGMLRPRN